MKAKKLITAILLLLFLMAVPLQVFAAEEIRAMIPFTVKNTTGTVVIEAAEGAPLPHRTVFEEVSEGIFELSFSEPGDYFYKVYQVPQTEKGVTYDATVYEVCVSVFVGEDGELYTAVAANEEGSSEKADELLFENTPPETTETSTSENPSPPKTGDDSRLGLWIALMIASLFVLIMCIPMRKKAK